MSEKVETMNDETAATEEAAVTLAESAAGQIANTSEAGDAEMTAAATSSSWTSNDESALMMYVNEVLKSKDAGADLLDDDCASCWDEIAEKFPSKTAIHCLQRYAKLKIMEITDSSKKRPAAEVAGATEDSPAKKMKVAILDNDGWTDEEVANLKLLVSQYPNSKYTEFDCT